MFKSVFTKYMTTFTLIILFSFLILILVVSSMVTNYSISTKQAMMESSAEMAANSLGAYKKATGDKDSYPIVVKNNRDDIYNSLITIDYLANSTIYIIDSNGNLLCSSESKSVKNGFLNQQQVKNIVLEPDKAYKISKIDDVFSDLRLNYFYLLEEAQGTTIVMVSSPDVGDPVFTSKMIKAIISVSLWIFLAALISVYFISERIVEPLRQISQAAQNFAKGKFDTRVKVSGHDEVATLAEAFNNMADSLGRLEETRSTFLANVSHDLRTPMTTISGFVDGIIDGTIPEEKRSYYLDIISSEVRRLSRLVSSLLQLSRIEAGETKLKMADFNLSEKARQILISFEGKIDDKKIDIEFNNEQDIFVNADTDAIHQVIYNLTDNAIKFTPKSGSIIITLTVKTVEKRMKKAVFSIKNSGNGIPAEEIPLIFDRFYKSDRSRGLDKTGTGLGLYIAKTTLINHGEDIKVSSEQGKYTEFVFTLPVAEKPATEKSDNPTGKKNK
ncbi:MAG: HAMP domain-containing sensor histidine kinase [Eubacteriales bacterium]|nr:HAMP domain-containing sensor histidine kinase [Eubacteriales bacterium]MDD4421483.1 HAMP domain-containing sensor histidine kinase [Eubacteriales bacterium]